MTDIDIDTNAPLPEGWQWDFLEDNGDALITSRWLCEHVWIEARRHGHDGDWWTEVWLTPDDCQGETHVESFDAWGDTFLEAIGNVGPLDDLDVNDICHYCSGAWPLPKEES